MTLARRGSSALYTSIGRVHLVRSLDLCVMVSTELEARLSKG
jgi:hypothetical protein